MIEKGRRVVFYRTPFTVVVGGAAAAAATVFVVVVFVVVVVVNCYRLCVNEFSSTFPSYYAKET